MKKLVVIFPGAGYGLDCPLLYYADFLYETHGYERLHLNYQNILLNTELTLEENSSSSELIQHLKNIVWQIILTRCTLTVLTTL